MNKYFCLIIALTLGTTTLDYGVNQNIQKIDTLIDTVFETCSLSDVYATLVSSQNDLIQHRSMHDGVTSALMCEQIQNLGSLLCALDPLIVAQGCVNIPLRSMLLNALEQERNQLKNKRMAHVDQSPWKNAHKNMVALRQSLSSSSLPEASSSATKTLLSSGKGGSISYIKKENVGPKEKPKPSGKEPGKEPEEKAEEGGSGLKKFALDLLLQFIIMKGLGEAEMLMSEDDRKAMQPVIDQFTILQKKLTEKQKVLQDQTKEYIDKLGKDYAKSFETLHTATEQVLQGMQDEYSYIMHLITIADAAQTFSLVKPITSDLLFQQSALETPNKRNIVWHNIWNSQYAYGNWLYDPTLNAFVQYGAPCGLLPENIAHSLQTQSLDDTNKHAFSPYKAEYNQIFTEYFPTSATYTIEAELTLVDAAFPFCCGIAFNKARWLSGSLDRSSMYRFVGIVGTLEKNGQKTLELDTAAQKSSTKKLGIYAAQASMDILGHITSPMMQLFETDSEKIIKPLITLDADVKDIGKNPIIYSFILENYQDHVLLTVVKNHQEKIIDRIFVLNKDLAMSKTLYWYHGIGFIAPRCQAAFSIKAPIELVYQDAEINAFKEKIEEELKKEQKV